MKLAYRIASQSAMALISGLSKDDAEWVKTRVAQDGLMIQSSSKFDLTNVAEFAVEYGKENWCLADIPNWTPPFHTMFAEWTEPASVRKNGSIVSSEIAGMQVGTLVRSVDLQNPRADLGDVASLILDWLITPSRRSGFSREVIASAFNKSRWMLFCSIWCYRSTFSDSPAWLGWMAALFVDAQGSLVSEGDRRGAMLIQSVNEMDTSAGVRLALRRLGLGISFCHCKNVTKEHVLSDRGERWHRRTKVPRDRFYTLKINPMKEVLKREGDSERTGIKKALHICRGHFATYSPDSPLFGKFVGTYWRPDHARGSADNGTVRKDYAVGRIRPPHVPEDDGRAG